VGGLRTWVAAASALVVAGAVVAGVADATAAKAIGFAISGLGAVVLTALAFYAVGRSEDRAREAERRDRP
jgi:hypothetical protein